MKQELSLRHNHQLILNTAMKQALHVLTLPLIELEPWLLQQIEANPLLSLEESNSFIEYSSEIPQQKSLYRHLMDQVALHFSSGEEKQMAEWIIGNLDERGFFDRPAQVSSSFLNVLEKVQRLDPPGIAAKDLKESLLVQLEVDGKKNGSTYLMIRDHFDEILGGSHQELRSEIGELDFYPGSRFSPSIVRPIKPDLQIRQSSTGWWVEVTNSELPEFHFVQSYLDLLESGSVTREEKNFIRSHMAAGKWLQRALSHRKRTLVLVGEYLTQKQPQCFSGLPPKPLTLQEAASDLGVHPSTMTRATQGKYCLTESGIMPLKSFFSNRSQQEALLKKLIARESQRAPLSDQRLSEKIHSEGFPIARRTVTKYRKALHIPSAKERKLGS